jgi:hypothetical protein
MVGGNEQLARKRKATLVARFVKNSDKIPLFVCISRALVEAYETAVMTHMNEQTNAIYAYASPNNPVYSAACKSFNRRKILCEKATAQGYRKVFHMWIGLRLKMMRASKGLDRAQVVYIVQIETVDGKKTGKVTTILVKKSDADDTAR